MLPSFLDLALFVMGRSVQRRGRLSSYPRDAYTDRLYPSHDYVGGTELVASFGFEQYKENAAHRCDFAIVYSSYLVVGEEIGESLVPHDARNRRPAFQRGAFSTPFPRYGCLICPS